MSHRGKEESGGGGGRQGETSHSLMDMPASEKERDTFKTSEDTRLYERDKARADWLED